MVNNRQSFALRNKEIVEEKWQEVKVGDIIRLKNNDFVAVSLQFISKNVIDNDMFIKSNTFGKELLIRGESTCQ